MQKYVDKSGTPYRMQHRQGNQSATCCTEDRQLQTQHMPPNLLHTSTHMLYDWGYSIWHRSLMAMGLSCFLHPPMCEDAIWETSRSSWMSPDGGRCLSPAGSASSRHIQLQLGKIVQLLQHVDSQDVRVEADCTRFMNTLRPVTIIMLSTYCTIM